MPRIQFGRVRKVSYRPISKDGKLNHSSWECKTEGNNWHLFVISTRKHKFTCCLPINYSWLAHLKKKKYSMSCLYNRPQIILRSFEAIDFCLSWHWSMFNNLWLEFLSLFSYFYFSFTKWYAIKVHQIIDYLFKQSISLPLLKPFSPSEKFHRPYS